jgi:hypothetical protein
MKFGTPGASPCSKKKKIILEVAGVLDFELMRQHFKVQGQCLEITGQCNIKKKTKIALP